MKAIICTKYGPPDVLTLRDVEKPIPNDNEVLIKVHAASVTTADCMMRRGRPFYGRLFIGLLRPKNPITGTGFAGVVEDLGKDVSLFKKGDSVFGETGVSFGSNAEYVCLQENGLITTTPDNISWKRLRPYAMGL